jgi:hypothetical protein
MRRSPRADHKASAAEAEAAPGTWIHVSNYLTMFAAKQTAERIRQGIMHAQVQPYSPAEHFEANALLTDEGADLWVRYVGPAGMREVILSDMSGRAPRPGQATRQNTKEEI